MAWDSGLCRKSLTASRTVFIIGCNSGSFVSIQKPMFNDSKVDLDH